MCHPGTTSPQFSQAGSRRHAIKNAQHGAHKDIRRKVLSAVNSGPSDGGAENSDHRADRPPRDEQGSGGSKGSGSVPGRKTVVVPTLNCPAESIQTIHGFCLGAWAGKAEPQYIAGQSGEGCGHHGCHGQTLEPAGSQPKADRPNGGGQAQIVLGKVSPITECAGKRVQFRGPFGPHCFDEGMVICQREPPGHSQSNGNDGKTEPSISVQKKGRRAPYGPKIAADGGYSIGLACLEK